MAGLTNSGLTIRRLSEVVDKLRQDANTHFGDLVESGDVLDTSHASTLGRMIGLVSHTEADLWEALQQVYSAFDPSSAEGVALDNLVALAGLIRKKATSSTARILFSGNYNTTIPKNSLVSSSFTNVRFNVPSEILLDENNVVGVDIKVQTVADSTLYTATYNDGTNSIAFNFTSGTGATATSILTGLRDEINNNLGSLVTATLSADVLQVVSDDNVVESSWTLSANLFFSGSTKGLSVVATETGPKEQPTKTIDTIVTPVLGWNSVDQPSPAIVGSNAETDSKLRERFSSAKFTRGSNLVDTLFSELINLDGVDEVKIYENVSNTTDSLGLPAHSFMVLAQGGLEKDIADAIWINKPAGIATHGNTSFTLEDAQGLSKVVKFQRPTFTDVFISVTVKVINGFPANGAEQIKGALTQFFADNARIGGDVIYSRLYIPLNSIPGHQVDSLTIGTTANPSGTTNIVIDFDKIAKLEVGNITVTVT